MRSDGGYFLLEETDDTRDFGTLGRVTKSLHRVVEWACLAQEHRTSGPTALMSQFRGKKLSRKYPPSDRTVLLFTTVY
ncbi:hypothetical protein EPA93_14315 [Ktedonosporobacter rubrisoli]|uniref:Uncharacterized protein n=1 Tax=Ktedonosporobacter rubrisoli TaxID=2509675 RepID=A0A4P6JPN7_KTERU|nr:hypothetical protein [Ktedonosporobacter rubrisoli]QBD77110.1 hypothetical protein EPA93_14315 [Ktedonosporobacter rubrisoli]